MQQMKSIKFVLLALIIALAFGCAKKPAATEPEAAPAPPPRVEQPRVEERAVVEAPVTETAPAQPQAVLPGLQRIHYEFDQFTLTAQAREVLAANAAYLKANSGVQVRIEGHCDERGSDQYNLALGERRARAAMDYLISLGVAPSRLSLISYGEERPLDPRSN